MIDYKKKDSDFIRRTISICVGKGSVNHNSREFNAKNTDPERTHEFREKLSEEEKKLLQQYTNLYNEFLSMSIADSFISGFRLGAKFTHDVFIK